MKKIQCFPSVPDLLSTCAMRPNSFPKACSFHMSLVLAEVTRPRSEERRVLVVDFLPQKEDPN